MSVAVDTDVLIKSALLDLLDHLDGLANTAAEVWMLGAAKFVLRDRLDRWPDDMQKARAQVGFQQALERFSTIEPSQDEVFLAASIEELAASAGTSLDIGESQLCAIVMIRGMALLLTGDKRAIVALESLLACEAPSLDKLRGRVACLEQFILSVIDRAGIEAVLPPLRLGHPVDRTLSICFSDPQHAVEALNSYVESLRGNAPSILVDHLADGSQAPGQS